MTRKPIFDPVQCKDMEGVKFIDIELRYSDFPIFNKIANFSLGQPYVFQHSGTCEHLFVFHDLRVLHRGDFQVLFSFLFLGKLEFFIFRTSKTIRYWSWKRPRSPSATDAKLTRLREILFYFFFYRYLLPHLEKHFFSVHMTRKYVEKSYPN